MCCTLFRLKVKKRTRIKKIANTKQPTNESTNQQQLLLQATPSAIITAAACCVEWCWVRRVECGEWWRGEKRTNERRTRGISQKKLQQRACIRSGIATSPLTLSSSLSSYRLSLLLFLLLPSLLLQQQQLEQLQQQLQLHHQQHRHPKPQNGDTN
ncbi:uncharacterized protein LOC133849415 [Drosophila sulfurigaster albostrigata]|uniref:uncharacterized protein LOC133849415 n=1 Tax=Drosophila sulfurigaster albostrigata TaxID=89887 RepID=UPI002D218B46|nr:uncharacterized protein LOC133849415 [Drosophila sulfurigaster albostrigata]